MILGVDANLASSEHCEWLDIRLRLPLGLGFDELALGANAIGRRRVISDADDLLRLALARGPGGKIVK